MKKKLLIIQGGGIFGVIPACFLSTLPYAYQTLNNIDLLAGCSIGGILAASYASGKTFIEGFRLFCRNADKCFTKRTIAKFNPFSCPTYSNAAIDEVLTDIIGNTTLGDTRNIYPNLDLIIPALNITDDKYKVFDNITPQDKNVLLRDIAGYTSAAPSYFAGRLYNGKCMVDGGLIEVSPLITAATALKSKRNIPFADMDILLIGTGKDIDEKPLTEKLYNGLTILGMATDVIVPYATLGNQLSTEFWGANLGFNSFTYFNPIMTNGALDEVEQIPALVKECAKHADEFCEVYKKWLES